MLMCVVIVATKPLHQQLCQSSNDPLENDKLVMKLQ